MKKELNERIYNLSRKWALDTITNGLGIVEESDDRIVCYVDKKKLKTTKQGITVYCTSYDEKIGTNYNIDKEITYIFDGIDFDNTLYLNSNDNVCVIFKNCTFNYDTYINTLGSCIIMDSRIGISTDIKLDVKQLAIINSRINSYGNIMINTTNHLHIFSSKIVSTNDNQNIELNSLNGNLVIHDCNVMGDTIVMSSPIIETNENSFINARRSVRFNSNSLNPDINCDTPRFVYNGRVIERDNNKSKKLRK